MPEDMTKGDETPLREFERSLVCGMCGKTLMLEEDVRYVVRISVTWAADPMELSQDDLRRDLREEMQRVIERAKDLDEQELMNSVHKEFRFYLCPRCQKAYIRNPLPPPPGDE